MSVYVDDVRHAYGRMIMCHLWADSLGELLTMASRIGMQHKWLQCPPKASWTHFDVSLTMKDRAISFGAILTDKYGPVEHVAKIDIASGDADRIRRGAAKLSQIAQRRGAITPKPV